MDTRKYLMGISFSVESEEHGGNMFPGNLARPVGQL
jgi:hypothetical protein